MTSIDFSFLVESISDPPTGQSSVGGRTDRDSPHCKNHRALKKDRETKTESETHPNNVQQEERQFILLLLKRDQQAWQDFVCRYEKLILSRVLSTCRELGVSPQSHIVEDCGAEVMATLFQGDMNGLRQFQGRSKLSTWLAVIARRTTLKFLRQQQRVSQQTRPNDSQFDMAVISENRLKSSSETSTEKQTIEEEQAALQSCLGQLKETDRTALMLHFDRKLCYFEIGQVLGISENAVGPKLHRAQKRLKKLMESRNRMS